MPDKNDPLKQELPPLAATGGVRTDPPADPPKGKKVLRGASSHNVVLKGGGYATVQHGQPLPDDISDESLKRLQDSGVLDNDRQKTDWVALAAIGTGPAPEAEAAKIRAAYEAADVPADVPAEEPSDS